MKPAPFVRHVPRTLDEALAKLASEGKLVLFVGTKRQAKETIEREAARSGMSFVNERWLGGTLTNYRTIRDRLKRLFELEMLWLPSGDNPAKADLPTYMRGMLNESGKLELSKAPETAQIRTYSKKMVATLNRELSKIRRNLQGIRDMNRMPDAMVVIDPKREGIAVKEAQRVGVTTVALIDTDCDPDKLLVQYWRDKKFYEYGLRRSNAILVQSRSQQQAMRRYSPERELPHSQWPCR